MSFLTPFAATADHALTRAHDRVAGQDLPPSIMAEFVTEIRASLSTLLPEQHEQVWAAVRLVRIARERGVRLPYGRVLAVVAAPGPRTVGRATIHRHAAAE